MLVLLVGPLRRPDYYLSGLESLLLNVESWRLHETLSTGWQQYTIGREESRFNGHLFVKDGLSGEREDPPDVIASRRGPHIFSSTKALQVEKFLPYHTPDLPRTQCGSVKY